MLVNALQTKMNKQQLNEQLYSYKKRLTFFYKTLLKRALTFNYQA